MIAHVVGIRGDDGRGILALAHAVVDRRARAQGDVVGRRREASADRPAGAGFGGALNGGLEQTLGPDDAVRHAGRIEAGKQAVGPCRGVADLFGEVLRIAEDLSFDRRDFLRTDRPLLVGLEGLLAKRLEGSLGVFCGGAFAGVSVEKLLEGGASGRITDVADQPASDTFEIGDASSFGGALRVLGLALLDGRVPAGRGGGLIALDRARSFGGDDRLLGRDRVELGGIERGVFARPRRERLESRIELRIGHFLIQAREIRAFGRRRTALAGRVRSTIGLEARRRRGFGLCARRRRGVGLERRSCSLRRLCPRRRRWRHGGRHGCRFRRRFGRPPGVCPGVAASSGDLADRQAPGRRESREQSTDEAAEPHAAVVRLATILQYAGPPHFARDRSICREGERRIEHSLGEQRRQAGHQQELGPGCRRGSPGERDGGDCACRRQHQLHAGARDHEAGDERQRAADHADGHCQRTVERNGPCRAECVRPLRERAGKQIGERAPDQ